MAVERPEKKEAKAPKPIEVEIIDKVEMPSVEPGRLGKIDVVVTYQIDPLHRYRVTIPAEKATDEAIEEAIRKDAQHRLKWIGRKVKV